MFSLFGKRRMSTHTSDDSTPKSTLPISREEQEKKKRIHKILSKLKLEDLSDESPPSSNRPSEDQSIERDIMSKQLTTSAEMLFPTEPTSTDKASPGRTKLRIMGINLWRFFFSVFTLGMSVLIPMEISF